MKYLLVIVAVLTLSCTTTQSTELTEIEINSIKNEIQKVMDKQSTDWSNGNIDAFMEGYWKDEKLRFVGSRGITYGWEQTKANYKKGYPDKSAMGKLEFEIKEVDVLTPSDAVLLGGFTLFRTEDTLSGNFTLTWKKLVEEWLITSDMTCG